MALGWDPDENAGMVKTPARFVKYLQEFNNPYTLEEVLGDLFEGPTAEDIHGMVVQGNIPFRMICEHHLLPAIGKAWVGYVPRGKVVGLSKIARLVERVGTSRPSMQELICEEVTDGLNDYAKALGAVTVIKSIHTCMACRGVTAPDTHTVTSCVRGIFRDVPQARAEFFAIAGIGNSGG
jgi:GTP cyclohydrolase I